MIRIQYRQLWNGGTWEDWRDVGSFDIAKGYSGSFNINMPAFGQSDRLLNSSTYGANALIACVFHVTASRDNRNVVTLSGGSMDSYQFIYDSTAWGSHIGASVVKGTYDYYAIDSGGGENFVYQYDGGDTVVADYTVPVSFSMTAVPSFACNPQETSNEVYYGRCYNEINGNNVQVYLRFKNEYPADYRPGSTYDGNWKSHNREGGAANIYGGSWNEMRTLGGDGSTGGEPPYIFNGSSWANQRLTGAE